MGNLLNGIFAWMSFRNVSNHCKRHDILLLPLGRRQSGFFLFFFFMLNTFLCLIIPKRIQVMTMHSRKDFPIQIVQNILQTKAEIEMGKSLSYLGGEVKSGKSK